MLDLGGLVVDAVVNHFAFAASATAGAAIDRVIDFFNGPNAGGLPISSYIGASRSRALGGWMLQATPLAGHLDGKNLPSPDVIAAGTLGNPSSSSMLPDQVAVVLSYHGVVSALPEHGGSATRPTSEEAQDEGAPATHVVSTRPRASLRGRIYLGPLEISAINFTTGDVSSAFLRDLGTAAERLVTGLDAWSVWSKTYSTLDPVVAGTVQQNTGTQRRRKDKTITRSAW